MIKYNFIKKIELKGCGDIFWDEYNDLFSDKMQHLKRNSENKSIKYHEPLFIKTGFWKFQNTIIY